MRLRHATLAVPFALAALAASAAQPKTDTFHVRMEGAYQARTVIAYQDNSGQADVTDRVILEFDWHDREHRFVTPPRLENVKSKVTGLRNVETSCPPPAPNGDYEHFDATAVKSRGGTTLDIVGVRRYPETRVTRYCQGSWKKATVPARTEEVVLHAGVPTLRQVRQGSPVSMKLGDWTWSFLVTPVVKP